MGQPRYPHWFPVTASSSLPLYFHLITPTMSLFPVETRCSEQNATVTLYPVSILLPDSMQSTACTLLTPCSWDRLHVWQCTRKLLAPPATNPEEPVLLHVPRDRGTQPAEEGKQRNSQIAWHCAHVSRLIVAGKGVFSEFLKINVGIRNRKCPSLS